MLNTNHSMNQFFVNIFVYHCTIFFYVGLYLISTSAAFFWIDYINVVLDALHCVWENIDFITKRHDFKCYNLEWPFSFCHFVVCLSNLRLLACIEVKYNCSKGIIEWYIHFVILPWTLISKVHDWSTFCQFI